MLIRELTTFDTRPNAKNIPPEASSDLGRRYHKTLNQMRDAYLYALDHRADNKIALRDLAALEPRLGQQILGAKSLRFCSGYKRMSEEIQTWKKFCREQSSKGGANAMMYLYGVEGWEDL